MEVGSLFIISSHLNFTSYPKHLIQKKFLTIRYQVILVTGTIIHVSSKEMRVLDHPSETVRPSETV